MNDGPLKFPIKITKPRDLDEPFLVYFPDLDESIEAGSFSDSFTAAKEFLQEQLLAGALPEPGQVLPFAREGQFTSFVTITPELVN